MAHRIVHGDAELATGVGSGDAGVPGPAAERPLPERLRDAIINSRRFGAGGVDKDGGSGRHGADAAPDGERLGHAAEQVEAHDASRIGIAADPAAGQQRLGLGGKAHRPTVVGPVERLDAQRIARQQQRALLGIPQAEGKHAAQLLHHVRAAVVVELQQHLGVGAAAEGVAALGEFLAQLAVIVDLAVEGDGVAATGAVHRLRAGRAQVDDGEPLMGEPRAPIVRQPQAVAVGAARRHAVVDALELGAIDRRGDVEIGVDTGYAAHGPAREVAATVNAHRCRGTPRQRYATRSRDQAIASSASGSRGRIPAWSASRRARAHSPG